MKTVDGLLPVPLPARIGCRVAWILGELGLGDWLLDRVLRRPLPFPAFEGELGAGDIVVSTPAKNGTNWMLQLATQAAWKTQVTFEHIHQVVPWPDCPIRVLPATLDDGPRSPSGHRVIKTHFGADRVPWSDDARYVVVLRDPKLVVESAYHFFVGNFTAIFRGEVPAERFLEVWLSGSFVGGDWAEHVASWWRLRDRPNVVVLTYARMKRDLPGVLDELCAFADLELEPQVRDEVLRRAGFAWMKEHNGAFAAITPRLRGELPPMVRSGSTRASGLFSADQLAEVDRRLKQRLGELGCELPYDELFGAR